MSVAVRCALTYLLNTPAVSREETLWLNDKSHAKALGSKPVDPFRAHGRYLQAHDVPALPHRNPRPSRRNAKSRLNHLMILTGPDCGTMLAARRTSERHSWTCYEPLAAILCRRRGRTKPCWTKCVLPRARGTHTRTHTHRARVIGVTVCVTEAAWGGSLGRRSCCTRRPRRSALRGCVQRTV